ncbi:GntR family transcriptional regulator (plasmid) [Agrobacterium sp. 13-2099-1-2]|jgi:GntR family transcriptional regulator|nr:GntR family transcriptional regulator [Agrobacterium sp. 13-2099-1-2]UZX45238.1 GntR family transcriptional regulator [Agrobacterium sp. 13-2099-1-2]
MDEQEQSVYVSFVHKLRVTMHNIDRLSAEPYYLQLARIIESEIRNGKYRIGDRVPGETELCRAFDLARSTVRETLRALEQQRLIKIVPRRGAFVSDPTENQWKLQVTQGFLETGAHSPDRSIETSVLRAGFEVLPDFAADALGIPKGENGFAMERIRHIDGKAAMHSTNYLPADVGALLLGKPVLEGKASLNHTLAEVGFSIYAARREVAAVGAPPDTATQLGLAKGAPVLLVHSTSRSEVGRAFDFYRSFVRSDVVTISVDAQAPLDAAQTSADLE